jgi:hypothetical protein
VPRCFPGVPDLFEAVEILVSEIVVDENNVGLPTVQRAALFLDYV